MNAVQKLRSLVDEIRNAPDPFKKVDAWALAQRLLSRTPGVDQGALKRAVDAKDVVALDMIVHGVEHPESRKKPETPSSVPDRAVSDDEMRHAMKAFRKRLKLARLSDESRLGGRYTSSGKASQIDAIIPPTEFGVEVWQALVKKGELEYTGEGFYALPGDTKRM